jgi:hypothetical protein
MVVYAMAHLSGTDRAQLLLLPEAVDDYVGPNNPVRFIEAFVDGLPDLCDPSGRRQKHLRAWHVDGQKEHLVKLQESFFKDRQASEPGSDQHARNSAG